jgi:hypothetical protein
LEAKFDDWRGVLHRQAPTARQILKKLLDGKITFTPKNEGYYEFEADGVLTKMLVGVTHPSMVTSPMPASWNQIASWLKQIDNLRQAA